MGVLMFPFAMVVLGMSMSILGNHRRSSTWFRPLANTHLGQRLANLRLRHFGSAEFDTDGTDRDRLGFDDPRPFSKPVGNRQRLAGVALSCDTNGMES